MNKLFTLLIFLFAILSKGFSQTIFTQWTYEPLSGTAANPTPNTGSGTSALFGSMITPSTATGMTGTGCGAQTTGALAWAIGTANPGTTNESSGVQFNTSTSGYTGINVSWDQRFSNTATNTVRLQYTTDGSTWTNFTMTGTNTTICATGAAININGCFETIGGDQYRRILVDLSSITAANNNANFGVRMLAAHYQATGEFRQANSPGSIATGGTWRFDNVTFSGTTVLPLSLLSFNAKAQGNNIIVDWKSANEISHNYYEVLYSVDGSNFIQAGQRNALVGSGEKVYTLTHQNASLLGSKLFYRLKMVSTTGVVTYSNIVIVRFGKQVQGITDVYPNPTTGIVTLIANATEQVQLNLIDASGKIIVSKQVFINNSYNLDLTKYANGIYILEATLTNGNKQQFKVVKK